ncbi:MAG TPA: MauE/DoxX family redox-associated membrane protein [Phycisphaerales bacterium]|nr:MauE/DoxX family redox-associated membrane protein [Phycisphaerales bacterium]
MSGGRAFGRSVLLVLRLVVAGLFIWAAKEKLESPLDFRANIDGFKVLPEHILDPLAFMVPWTELVCAAALIVGFWARSAALAIGAMLVLFMAAIASVLLRGMHVECGCFGDYSLLCKPGAVGWCNVGQNALLLAIALPVMIWGAGALSLDSRAARRGRGIPAAGPVDTVAVRS